MNCGMGEGIYADQRTTSGVELILSYHVDPGGQTNVVSLQVPLSTEAFCCFTAPNSLSLWLIPPPSLPLFPSPSLSLTLWSNQIKMFPPKKEPKSTGKTSHCTVARTIVMPYVHRSDKLPVTYMTKSYYLGCKNTTMFKGSVGN